MSMQIMWITITSIICFTVFLSVAVYSGTKYGEKYTKLHYKYGLGKHNHKHKEKENKDDKDE